MRMLAFFALMAGTAAIPAAAAAQHGPTQPGAGQPRAGHSWRADGPRFRHDGPRMHPGRDFPHRRLRPGVRVHPFWFGPQFQIHHWQSFGLHQPWPDHRWIRYYDDAYMVDRYGTVADARYGLDWDRYGHRWGDDQGIPYYVGEGDYHPDARDHAWVDQHGGWDYSEYGHGQAAYGAYDYGPAAGAPQCRAQPQPCPGAGHAYYGYGYPLIIETTVTPIVATTTTYIIEEVIEERVVTTRQRARRPAPRPAPRPPARRPARPPAGERG